MPIDPTLVFAVVIAANLAVLLAGTCLAAYRTWRERTGTTSRHHP